MGNRYTFAPRQARFRSVFAPLLCYATGMADARQMQPDPNPRLHQPYLSYLLRLWQEQVDGQPCWRASLESVQSGEQIAFASWEQVVDFLVQEQRKEEAINRLA